MTGKVTRTIHRGDVFRYEMAGAGGWGDPLDREPVSVLKDVRNEYVSLNAARHEYGVVIDAQSWSVDEDQTSALRKVLRRERNWGEVPFIDRGPLPPGAQ